MSGTITALRFQKRTADRVNVYLDGAFAFAVPALEAARLRVGAFVDDAEVERLRALGSGQKAYDRAIRFLSYRPRSTAEVRRHLSDAGCDAEEIEATLARLAEHGYLNDAEFARFWVENRQRFRPKGAQALRQELRRHGLEAEEIEQVLAEIDASESIYLAARPRAQRLRALAAADPLAFRRKLSDFLLRRGFEFELIQEVVIRLLREVTAEEPEA